MADSFSDLNTMLGLAADLAAQPGLPAGPKALAGTLATADAAYREADLAVRKAVESWGKEAPEAAAAVDELAAIYDSARVVAQLRLPGIVDDGPASEHGKTHDTLEAAELLADRFQDHADEPWTQELGPGLEAALAKATSEVDEKRRAGEEEQIARSVRAQKAEEARAAFRSFRRLIRMAYGASSRQYQSIRDRRRSRAAGTTES